MNETQQLRFLNANAAGSSPNDNYSERLVIVHANRRRPGVV